VKQRSNLSRVCVRKVCSTPVYVVNLSFAEKRMLQLLKTVRARNVINVFSRWFGYTFIWLNYVVIIIGIITFCNPCTLHFTVVTLWLPERKRSLEKPRGGWGDNIKSDVIKWVRGWWVDAYGSGQGRVAAVMNTGMNLRFQRKTGNSLINLANVIFWIRCAPWS
jgi:hypothetical protein